jgi:hypothetical protein
MCSSATKRFGHLHFHLVHFKELNTATAKIFVIFNLFYYYAQEISMSSCMCACVHLISLTGSMFMNVGMNMMPKENTPTLVIKFLHSGTKTQQIQELTDVGVTVVSHTLQPSMVHGTRS